MAKGSRDSPTSRGRTNSASTTPSRPGRCFHGAFSLGLRSDRTARRPAPVPRGPAGAGSTTKSIRGTTVAPWANRGP